MWDEAEEKKAKKLRKLTKNAAYAIGGGLGLWFMKALYPQHEGAEKIANIFGPIGWLLVVYGAFMLGVLALKRDIALRVNGFVVWMIIPAVLVYILMGVSGS